MVMPIQSLMNMENMLYCGRGINSYAPSMFNNYQGRMYSDNSTTSLFNYGYNPAFGSYGTNFGQVTVPQDSANTSFQQGITQEDINKLADYYANNNALEEGFKGALTGGLSWMAFEHAQSILHPKNAIKGFKAAEEVFKDIPKEFLKENSILLQDAHIAIQQAIRDTYGKRKISGWLRSPIGKHHAGDADKIKDMVSQLKTAIEHQDKDAIAELTQKLQKARGFDGKLIMGEKLSVDQRLAKKANEIQKEKNVLLSMNKGTLGNLVKQSFKKDFVGFMIFETAFSLGKISTAFKKDTKTGLTQTGQSAGKAALGTAGWCVGRAAGTLLGAKAGAVIGSAICPGAGTIAGALIGFTLGSIGMWAGHKLGNAVFGKDVADKVTAENMTKTQDGQAQLLQFAAQKTQEGKADKQTQQIVYKALNAYA